MRSSATRIFAAAGIAAPLLWAAAVIYCGAVRPGYNAVTQFISELAERGSSTENVMRITAFYIPGVLIVMFGVLLLTRSAGLPVAALLIIHGVSRVTAGAFPCDTGCPVPGSSLSQVVHNGAGMLNGITLVAAALFYSFHVRKIGHHRFARYSLFSGLAGTVFLVLMFMDVRTRSHVGLFQRLSYGIMHLWLGVFAISIWLSKIKATNPGRTAPA